MAVPWSEIMFGEMSARNSWAVLRSVVMGSWTKELPAKTMSPTRSLFISPSSLDIVRLANSSLLGAMSSQSIELEMSRQIIASIPLLSSLAPAVRPAI